MIRSKSAFDVFGRDVVFGADLEGLPAATADAPRELPGQRRLDHLVTVAVDHVDLDFARDAVELVHTVKPAQALDHGDGDFDLLVEGLTHAELTHIQTLGLARGFQISAEGVAHVRVEERIGHDLREILSRSGTHGSRLASADKCIFFAT